MLRAIRSFIRFAYGDDLPPLEKWCFKNSTKCSPDEIIAAAIIESIAKDFEAWDWSECSTYTVPKDWAPPKYRISSGLDRRLRNKAKDITIYYDHAYKGGGNYEDRSFYVNGTALDAVCGRSITSQYKALKKRRDAVKAAEAKAIADLQRNEAAWNLAEKLLNMKRNEHGALVPAVSVESAECPQ